MNPILRDSQILRLAETTDKLVQSMPQIELKQLMPSTANGVNGRKRISKDIEVSLHLFRHTHQSISKQTVSIFLCDYMKKI